MANFTHSAALALLAAATIIQAHTVSAEPQVSVIFDLRASSYSLDPEDYQLPGFQLGGEAGLPDEGGSLGHTEFTISGDVGDRLEGKFTGVMHQHEGEIEVELEELWLQTVGLGSGLTVKGGRFFSDIGYLNNRHPHAWDFVDEPLVYRSMLGMQYRDNGIQASWIAPTDIFWRMGGEALRGDRYPFAREGDETINSWVIYTDFGGDIDESKSWQIGFSHLRGSSHMRESGHGHDHEHEEVLQEAEEEHTPAFGGDTELSVVDLVYKWAPDGNYKNRSFVLQLEYFDQKEDGEISMLHEGEVEEYTPYTGDQNGAYIQGVYRFHPHWKAGLRYDKLFSDNRGDDEILEESGLASTHNPSRISTMVAWVPREYATVRLQYSRDKSRSETDHQWFLQFVYGIGPHGAHQF